MSIYGYTLATPHSTGTGQVACSAMEMFVQLTAKFSCCKKMCMDSSTLIFFHDLSIRHQEINLGNSQDNLQRAGSSVAKTSWLK